MRYSERLIKAQIFPLRDEITPDACGELISELVEKHLVIVYEADGLMLLQITNFAEHQHPQKPKKSEFPAPVYDCYGSDTVTVPYNNDTDTVTDKNSVPPAKTSKNDMSMVHVQYDYDTSMVSNSNRSSSRRGKRKEKEKKSPPNEKDDNEAFAEFAKAARDIFNVETNSIVDWVGDDAWLGLRRIYDNGRTLDDVRLVVKNQRDIWSNDAKMCQFIRPSTLFGKKFDEYLAVAKQKEAADAEFDDYA